MVLCILSAWHSLQVQNLSNLVAKISQNELIILNPIGKHVTLILCRSYFKLTYTNKSSFSVRPITKIVLQIRNNIFVANVSANDCNMVYQN